MGAFNRIPLRKRDTVIDEGLKNVFDKLTNEPKKPMSTMEKKREEYQALAYDDDQEKSNEDDDEQNDECADNQPDNAEEVKDSVPIYHWEEEEPEEETKEEVPQVIEEPVINAVVEEPNYGVPIVK